MLPTKSIWLVALVVYAMFVLVVAYLIFSSAASAASVGGRPFRGYADICVSVEPMRCVSARTIGVYDTGAECEHFVADAIAEYRKQFETFLFVQTQCRFDPGLYDA